MDAALGWLTPSTLPNKLSARWSSLGPYYAMFPVAFARAVIGTYTSVGDAVLDPFAGRGTSIFCALESGREALGVELNPLGWIYGCTKIAPAPAHRVIDCIQEIGKAAKLFEPDADRLPAFFHVCFSKRIRCFLSAARTLLRWRTRQVDRTAMAFLLVYLHGKIERGRPNALSNQMRQTKAMAPDYSIAWWRENGFAEPPDIDPVTFLTDRVLWRYAKSAPTWDSKAIRLGDCREVMRRQRASDNGRFQLLLTSPPYRGVTSYYYDQWLRFWLLGDAEHPVRNGKHWKGKFEDGVRFERLINDTFRLSRRLLARDAAIYVRTDARPKTFDVTHAALKRHFPSKRISCVPAPYEKATQTSLFGDHRTKPGEIDLILLP